MVELLGGQETVTGDPAFPVAVLATDVPRLLAEAPPPLDCYTVQPGQISGINVATTFCGPKAAQVRTFITGLGHEYDPAMFGKEGLGQQIAEGVYETLDPYYGEGGVFEPVTAWVDPGRSLLGEFGPGKDKLLLYGALAIGALALLKR